MDGNTPETRKLNHDSDLASEQGDTSKPSRFGKPTPHCHHGRNVARSLRWLGETEKFSGRDPVWRRCGSRERLAVQLGVMDTNQRKHTFPAGPWCGIPPPADKGHTEPGQRDGSGDVRRRLLHRLRNQLKTANFSRFSSLLQAFTHYDREGKGWIDKQDLQTVCQQSQLCVSGSVLDDLMDYCDVDRDGLISFVEFANFLSWKDMMPITRQEERVLTKEDQSSAASAAGEDTQAPPRRALVQPEDLEPINPAGSLKSVRTLVKQPGDPDQFRTMSSVIGLGDESWTPNRSSFGTDLPAPRVQRGSDPTNHGRRATASGLLHPSVYQLYGVDEEQLRPRSRTELSQVFRNVGVDLPEETFEEVWKLASEEHEAGEVCVESFCRLLKEIKAM